MNGPIEQVGNTARTLITSLATTPMIFALVVFNIFYIGFSTWQAVKQGERFIENQATWERMVEKQMSFCLERKS